MIVTASSPDQKHYKGLFKADADKRYLPCWSIDELKQCQPISLDDTEFEKRFFKWGGIPR